MNFMSIPQWIVSSNNCSAPASAIRSRHRVIDELSNGSLCVHPIIFSDSIGNRQRADSKPLKTLVIHSEALVPKRLSEESERVKSNLVIRRTSVI